MKRVALAVLCASLGTLTACSRGSSDSGSPTPSGPDTTAPQLTDLLASQAGGGQITLRGVATDDVGVSGYCFAKSATQPQASDSCFQSSSDLVVSALLPSTPYYVWARDAAGNVSKNSIAWPCTKEAYAASTAYSGQSVCMRTSLGEIVIGLSAKAPGTTANFLKYVNSGFYAGTVFHRVAPNFVMQAGGFNYSGGFIKKTATYAAIPLETTKVTGLSNTSFTIAMARTNEPNSATSEFFINSVDNSAKLDAASNADGYGYAVFGNVIYGVGASLTAIQSTPVVNSSILPGEISQPTTPPVINWAYQLK